MKLSKVQQRLVDQMRKHNYRITWDTSVYKFIDTSGKLYRLSKGATQATIARLEKDGVLLKTVLHNLRLSEYV